MEAWRHGDMETWRHEDMTKGMHGDIEEELFQGKIEKMSKSKLNVIDLESMLATHGADAIRMFVLSDSPAEKDLEWSAAGLDGCKKFISRLILFINNLSELKASSSENKKLQTHIHLTIKEVSEDVMHYRLNKAIARIRELYNAMNDELASPEPDSASIKEGASIIIQLLNPFIPHITEELWQQLGNKVPLYKTQWPKADTSKLQSDSYTMAIQVNGKLRATHEFVVSDSDEHINKTAIEIPAIIKHIGDAEIRKIIIVPKKIVNIVL